MDQTGVVLKYEEKVEQLTQALHTRTDIGIALGILMERYKIDRDQAFSFLSRVSQNENVKVRVLALLVADSVGEPSSGKALDVPEQTF